VSATPGTGTAEPAVGGSRPAEADAIPPQGAGHLFGIGAAAARAGVTERALRYYQQLGLLTPTQCTPGGMRRYSDEDLARVARIRQLQTLLGLNLDEVATVLRGEDRLTEIRRACQDGDTSDAERLGMARESLQLLQDLRATVEGKRQAIDGFLTDLDARIARSAGWLARMSAEPGRR
jgi:MerR family transcriptional regulator, repressor of the yfmOP operon